MKQLQLLAEQQDRHRRAEHRHQMEERRGAVRADQRDAAVEEQIGQRRGEDQDIGQRRQRQTQSNFSVAPVENSQIENGTSISAPQQVVKEISDSWCVIGRRGISAE